MSNIVIKVEGVSKQYRLGELGTGSFSEDIRKGWAKFRGRQDPTLKVGQSGSNKGELVLSLKDINFEIEKGDAVGIIGKNGAGKSTLLKILSRITAPTTGSLRVKGRLAALLEVGTGFHPELSGRDNIFLNGAILGMSKSEIKRKFDEIVDFSGVEQYIDTPVKRYSSGMYVRLAFAVAAHLESEILIVDEVLAVGDAEFQKKCLGKMKDVSKGEGRTVLFVSHNMQAVNTLCNKGIFMKKGCALPMLSAKDTVSLYARENEFSTDITFPIDKGELIIHNFLVLQNGHSKLEFDGSEDIDIIIDFEIDQKLTHFRIGFFIKNNMGELIHRSLLADWDTNQIHLDKGRYKLKGIIPSHYLTAGNYILQVHASRFGIKDYGVDELTSTQIIMIAPDTYNQGYIGESIFGYTLIKQNWVIENV